MLAVELALASPVNVLIVVRTSLKEALQRRFPEYEFVVVADLTQSHSTVSKLTDCGSRQVATCQSPTEDRRVQETK
jgi:hypothetical protein